MHAVVVVVVIDGEQDEADCAYDCGDGANHGVDLLPDRRVGRELAGVAHVALEDERQVEGNHGDGGHGDEHGL